MSDENAALKADLEQRAVESAKIQDRATELQEERDGLLGETERLRSELADLQSGPTPEEQRFLRTLTKVLLDLRETAELGNQPVTEPLDREKPIW